MKLSRPNMAKDRIKAFPGKAKSGKTESTFAERAFEFQRF
jgi:hypothetical protein